METTDNTGKWVEDLFPPTFAFSWDNFIRDLEVARNEKKLPCSVSPLDVSAIKNVYERVYLRSIIQKEEEERAQVSKADEDSPSCSLTVQQDGIPGNVDSKDLDKSAIWNSTEINVLREVFKTAREQNSKYKFIIQDLNEQLAISHEKCRNLEKDLKTRTGKLSEAIKANQRLTIRCETYSNELEGAQTRVANLSQNLTEVKTLRAQEMLEHQDLRMKMEKLRMEHRKLTNQLSKMNEEYLHDRTMREDEIKLIYDKEIEFVLDRLEEMTRSFETEREEHVRTKNALDHLRTHFSALDNGRTSMVVSKDEISRVDYI